MAKTPKQGGAFIGGYHKLPKNKDRFILSPRRFGSESKNPGVRAYQNEHYQRAGNFGNKTHAESYSKRYNKSVVAGAASMGAGMGSAVLGQSKMVQRKGAVPAIIGLGATALAGSAYSRYQQHKMQGMLDRDTNTRRSAVVGYYSTEKKNPTQKKKKK